MTNEEYDAVCKKQAMLPQLIQFVRNIHERCVWTADEDEFSSLNGQEAADLLEKLGEI